MSLLHWTVLEWSGVETILQAGSSLGDAGCCPASSRLDWASQDPTGRTRRKDGRMLSWVSLDCS